MENFLEVTMLSVLQGVAEFLPISSSGHLVILQHIFEVPENLRMRLEVFLHAGTMLSIFVFYAKRIFMLLGGIFAFGSGEETVQRRREAWLYAGRLLVSTLPAIAIYFTFKDQIESLTANARMVGALLMFTGAVLIGTRFLPRGSRQVGWMRAFIMGVGQAIALLPGVSRSGMTLASARGGRVDPDAARAAHLRRSAAGTRQGRGERRRHVVGRAPVGLGACRGDRLFLARASREGAEGTLVLAFRAILHHRGSLHSHLLPMTVHGAKTSNFKPRIGFDIILAREKTGS